MKTTVQSPATTGTDSIESIQSQAKSLVKAKLEYIAASIAVVGFIIMSSAPETDIIKPMIGCGLIIVAALILVNARKEASNVRTR